ncbi:MAG: fibronectin type III domain-containing protein [Dermatophilus congolensis]|nr:fibronectin type III domain-containing protein [Dermatophilus congolensis]
MNTQRRMATTGSVTAPPRLRGTRRSTRRHSAVIAALVAFPLMGSTLVIADAASAATPAPGPDSPLTVAPTSPASPVSPTAAASPLPDTAPTPVPRPVTGEAELVPGEDGKIHVTIPRNAFPVRSDNDGVDYDNVIVRRVDGVLWKVDGRKVEFAGRDDYGRVDTGGATSVTVTVESADPARYVLDDTPTWTIPFTTGTRVTIEPDQAPVGQDTPGLDDDWVILTKIDGVTWTVDGKNIVFPDETHIMRVPISTPAVQVKAIVAEGYDMSGQSTWSLAYPMSYRSTSDLPRTTFSHFPRGAEKADAGRRITWGPFPGAQGPVTYDVYYRSVHIDRYGKRSISARHYLVRDTTRTSAVFKAKPGSMYEVGVRGTDARGVRSEWSDPRPFVVPTSATGTTGRLRGGARMVADAASIGGDLVNMTGPGASWTLRTRHTDRVDLSFATGPTTGNVDIYLDGRKVRTVSTYSATWQRRNHLVTVPVTWGQHTVKVVNRPVGKRTTSLIDAYGLGS